MIEQTKEQLAKIRSDMEVAHRYGIQPAPHQAWVVIQTADSLVETVERVQALHTGTCRFNNLSAESMSNDLKAGFADCQFEPPCQTQSDCKFARCWTCDRHDPCDTRQAVEKR